MVFVGWGRSGIISFLSVWVGRPHPGFRSWGPFLGLDLDILLLVLGQFSSVYTIAQWEGEEY